MELADRQQPHTQRYGTDTVVLAAGDRFRIQSWNPVDGIVDVLAEVTVPDGKAWSVSLIVDTTETDA